MDGVLGQERAAPPQKDTGRQEERSGRVKNSYVTIINGAYVLEGSLSEVVTPPPHNLDTLHVPVAGYTHTHKNPSNNYLFFMCHHVHL